MVEIGSVEMHREYLKKLREKSTFKEYNGEIVNCECGGRYLRRTEKYHVNTRMHQNFRN